MNRKLKYVFCNSTPGSGNTEIAVTGIGEDGKIFEGTVSGPALTNWLATNAHLTPVAIGGGTDDQETRQARVG